MKLILANDAGEVLDSVDITAEEWKSELELRPHSILSALEPGADALKED